MVMRGPSLSEPMFRKFAELLSLRVGMFYDDHKREMFRLKIARHMRRAKVYSCEAFYRLLLQEDSRELWADFVDDMTVHTTRFFRERHHFNYLQSQFSEICQANPRILERMELRAWSAATSTGEEAYTLAMVLRETLGDAVAFRVLATDVSRGALLKALAGEYQEEIRKDVAPLLIQRYFKPTPRGFSVGPELRRSVVFRLFNLVDQFPFARPLDVIFCRNVMIYLPAEAHRILLQKLSHALAPGGLLFVGHAESLANKEHRFRYIQPTIYMR